MYANYPEMAKKWEKHTPKGTSLPEKTKKKKKRKKKADITTLSSLYVFAAEIKDRFDYLRKQINELKSYLENKNYDTSIFAGINNILSKEIIFNWKEEGEIPNINNELYKIRKYLMSLKEYELSNKVNSIIKELQFAVEKGRHYYEQFKYLPRKEFAHPKEGILYHGTNPSDAYSMLKSGEVLKVRSFNNISFTADKNVASKFGNIIFGFDARILQRRGAKKMKYLPEKEFISKLNKGEESEEYRNLFITDIYKYEQEWALPLPFKFSEKDLKKIIILISGKDDLVKAENTKNKLETANVWKVPIEIEYLSVKSLSESTGRENEIDFGDLKYNLFKYLIKPLTEIQTLAKNIVKDIFKKESKYWKDKGYDEKEIKEILLNDSDIKFANFLYSSLHRITEGSNWWGRFDLRKIKDVIFELSYRESAMKGKFEVFVPIVNELKNNFDKIIKAFTNTYFNKDEDFINAIKSKWSSEYSNYKDVIADWAFKNPEKLNNILLEAKNNKESEEVYSYDRVPPMIKKIIETLLNKISGKDENEINLVLDKLPIEVLRSTPNEILDFKDLYKVSKNKISDIFKNNEMLEGWMLESITPPEGFRYIRVSEENKKVYLYILENCI